MIQFLILWSAFGRVVLGEQAGHLDGQVVGVDPSRQHLYEATSGKWACLNDTTVVLRADQINNGICDCPDGSDEPGTGACGSGGPQFYCANEGFLPKYISQSKVGDGVCDCCDCSDELLSGVEPFYRGTGCSELQKAYNEIVEAETQRHKEGSQALRELYHKYNLDSVQEPVDKDLLASRIEELARELVSNELLLSETRARYDEKLMADNPVLYEFGRVDVSSVVSGVNSAYKRVIEFSKAFEDLLKILESLQENYSKSLNDRVVNENVKKFNFLKLHGLSKLSFDPKVQEEQRQQLVEYFQQELPQIFTESKVDKPSSYMVGKLSFVEKMILSKAEYVSVLGSKIKQLSGLMSDVSENYNVNYQDAGVKEAVESYKGWLAQYQSLKMDTLFSDDFKQKLELVKSFVLANSKNILTSDAENGIDSNLKGFLQHLNFLKGEIANFFKPNLKSQIEQHESTVSQLREKLALKRKEFEAIQSAEVSPENRDIERLKRLISAFSSSEAILSTIDNYSYTIILDQSVYQKEDSNDGNQVKIGSFKELQLHKEEYETEYFEYLKSKYSDNDDLFPALVNEIDNIHLEYLIGSLHNINNGLVLQYAAGDKCWNGPLRAAKVTVHCGKNFRVLNVYESTKCNYTIDLEGPMGCSLSL